MSPGLSIAIASSAVTTGLRARSTAFDARRASIRSLTERLDGVERAEPECPSLEKCFISVRKESTLLNARLLVELLWIEDRLRWSRRQCGRRCSSATESATRYEESLTIRVRVYSRRFLVEAHGSREPIHRLEQCRQQETYGACPEDVHPGLGIRACRQSHLRTSTWPWLGCLEGAVSSAGISKRLRRTRVVYCNERLAAPSSRRRGMLALPPPQERGSRPRSAGAPHRASARLSCTQAWRRSTSRLLRGDLPPTRSPRASC